MNRPLKSYYSFLGKNPDDGELTLSSVVLNSKILICGFNSYLEVWNLTSSTPISQTNIESAPKTILLLNERNIFCHDENVRVIVGFENGNIIRFNLTTAMREFQYQGHDKAVRRLQWCHSFFYSNPYTNSLFLSESISGIVKLWDVRNPRFLNSFLYSPCTPFSPPCPVSCLKCKENYLIGSWLSAKSLKIVDICQDKELGSQRSVIWFDFDDEILVTFESVSLYVWNYSKISKCHNRLVTNRIE
jgi:WD40 repeat protein